MRIDAHHHLWDLEQVHYPWILDETPRFFGDHSAIRRNYLIDEFRADAEGFNASVHIQVGAADPLQEARWIQTVSDAVEDWPMRQVAFCDVTAADFEDQLTALKALPSLVGLRQIVGRSPEEDAQTGTNDLLDNPKFLDGLKRLGQEGLSFDLQLIPELMPRMAELLGQVPELKVALCHAGSPYDRSEEGLAAWEPLLAHLADCHNVTCKLSGLGMFDHGWTPERLAPIVDACLFNFGSKRLMFGSNFPVDKLTSDYETLVACYQKLLPKTDQDDVFFNTANQFYFFGKL